MKWKIHPWPLCHSFTHVSNIKKHASISFLYIMTTSILAVILIKVELPHNVNLKYNTFKEWLFACKILWIWTMKEKRRKLIFFSASKMFLLQQVLLFQQVWRVWFCSKPLLELCMLWEKIPLSSTVNTTAFRVLTSHNVLKTLPRIYYYRIWFLKVAWPNGYSLCFFSRILDAVQDAISEKETQ